MSAVKEKLTHHVCGIMNNQIGIVNYWAFKDSFLFLNYEAGEVQEVKKHSDVKVISGEEFNALYDERNIKEGNEREKQYGKVHETFLKVMSYGTTRKSGKWSNDFGRDVMFTKGEVELYKELCQHYGPISVEEAKTKPLTSDIAIKHLMPAFKSDKLGLGDKVFEELITEEEIKELFAEYKSIPKEWQLRVKFKSEEADYYMGITPENSVEIKIEKIDVVKIKSDEETFIEGVKNGSIKANYMGHIVYGNGVEGKIKETINERVLEGKPEVDTVKPFVGSKIFSEDTCYYCGEKISYHIKSSLEIVAFSTHREDGESYRIPKKENHSECELSSKESRDHRFELTFPSGEVMIDNFFQSVKGRGLFNVPKDEEYSDKYSLQTLKGRFKRQDYLAKTYNVGYAQMGNMSVDVFVSKDKKKIVIGKSPEYTTNKHKKFNEKFEKEFTNIGEISLRVWRWECVDKQLWEAFEDKVEGDLESSLMANVIPGTYEVKHSNRFQDYTGKYSIYSEIKLKTKLK